MEDFKAKIEEVKDLLSRKDTLCITQDQITKADAQIHLLK